MNVDSSMKVKQISVQDIRFPTSLSSQGSDAMHPDPDYSCAYVILDTNTEFSGYGLTFTCGRGTEIVVAAVNALSHIIIDKNVRDIFLNFSVYWRKITSDTQLRWLGPEKGVIHIAGAALINALWDLWARTENKPVWKLLVDMDPELLVSTIDFRYLSDVLTKEEALRLLNENIAGKAEREKYMRDEGYPAYTTQIGWLGYSDEKVKNLCKKYLSSGFTGFKVKVGQNLNDDKRRCKLIRDIIGDDKYLMIDANQKWDINEAIDWVSQLSEFNILWIEEPTSPDDILGHKMIAEALKPLNVGVAGGEVCCNRVMFKQFLQSGAFQFCQIDSCRLCSINEILSVYLMAKKFNIPVCPHAGGVGLCEMVQHLQIFDYICLTGRIRAGQFIEYVDEEHDYFTTNISIKNAKYLAPTEPGYGVRFKEEIFEKYEFPNGIVWKSLK